MLKRILSVLLAVCMLAAFVSVPAFAATDYDLQVKDAIKAIRALEKGEKTGTFFNDMTMDEFLREATKALPENSRVTLSFSKEADYRIYNASSQKDGSIFANICFTCDTYTQHDMFTIKLPMLTGDAAANNADVEKLAEDRAAVSNAFKNISLENSTTIEDILSKARAAVKNGTVVEDAGDFTKVESTEKKLGSIKVTLNLTLNNEKATVKVNNAVRLVEATPEKTETKTDENTDGKTETEVKPADVNFADVAADAYYANAVKWAVEKGITTGTSATTFSPSETCTRAQILTFLWRAQGSPKSEDGNPFGDVSADDYYYEAAAWANDYDMIDDVRFGADTPCTRESTVTYIWKSMGMPAATTESTFTDVAEDAEYAEAVAWAVENGVTSGTSATTFSPNDICDRGQIVTFLSRAINK